MILTIILISLTVSIPIVGITIAYRRMLRLDKIWHEQQAYYDQIWEENRLYRGIKND